MTEPLKTLARWSRRHGFKLGQLALLAWIALELHGINGHASTPAVDPADVAEIADRLDDIVDAMEAARARAGVDTVTLRQSCAGRLHPPAAGNC
jgi:hypothetical protein